MDEYGDTPCIFVWPAGHEQGTCLPIDFWQRLMKVLADNGFAAEAAN